MGKSYLLATDGSERSKASEEYVADLLHPEDVTIHLLKVIDLFDEDKLSEITLGENVNELQKRHEAKAEKLLKPRRRMLQEHGFETETHVVHGNPGEEICRLSEELNVDGIFMGRGRHSKLGEMFYGSVSHYVIMHSDVSVIVTPARN